MTENLDARYQLESMATWRRTVTMWGNVKAQNNMTLTRMKGLLARCTVSRLSASVALLSFTPSQETRNRASAAALNQPGGVRNVQLPYGYYRAFAALHICV